jgi:Flp pilus assembly protein TadG
MDGVGPQVTTAMEDQYLLPLLLLVVVGLVEVATEVMGSVLMENAVQG